jgi:hypothetical protein
MPPGSGAALLHAWFDASPPWYERFFRGPVPCHSPRWMDRHSRNASAGGGFSTFEKMTRGCVDLRRQSRVVICRFPERGCARSVSRSRPKTLRRVFDTAALPSNWDIANYVDQLPRAPALCMVRASIGL